MFIQSYQINNILSVYRKQLSQPAGRTSLPTGRSRMMENQRQSIMDQVSVEIATRMAGGGFEKPFEMALDRAREATSAAEQPQRLRFTYTLIDENNRKWTNSLPVDEFYPVVGENSALETLAPSAGLMIARGTQPRFTQTWEGGPHD